MVEIKAELIVPLVPNYILVRVPGSLQAGDVKIPIYELSAEQKDDLARLWREEMDRVAERQDGDMRNV